VFSGVPREGAGTLPSYGCPNSPGENDRQEQNPSEEVIMSVRPSLAHARSVNVAK
jgi:hypothetical protein